MSMKRIDTRIKFQPSEKALPKIKAYAARKKWSLPVATSDLIDSHPVLKKESTK